MTTHAPVDGEIDWYAANDRYLSASLRWLRLVLEGSTPTRDESTRRRWWKRRSTGNEPADAQARRERIVDAAEARASAANVLPPPALESLAGKLGLSDFERDVVLLCAAMELDPDMAAACARGQRAESAGYPTFALALRSLPDPAWDALSPNRGLRLWGLTEPAHADGVPLTASALRADERIVNYVKGLNELDPRIETLVSPTAVSPVDLPPSLAEMAEDIVRRWERAAASGTQAPAIQLTGSDLQTKLDVAANAADEIDLILLKMPVEHLPAAPAELESLARLWQRENLLLPIALLIDAQEVDDGFDLGRLQRFVGRSEGVCFVATREPTSGFDLPTMTIEVTRPTAEEQRSIWTDALGPASPRGLADALAAQFDLAPSAIRDVVEVAIAEVSGGDTDPFQRVWDATVDGARIGLDQLAQRIDPRAGWADLVLPEDDMAMLRQIADQVAQRTRVYDDWGFAQRMSRGLGLSVLFTGPSGTGKTMAAEVLASHLRLNLYRIDLAVVVSKYIGETEKNLRRLFDAAESGPALLFFDEADALFGKRSEVKDAHDRYANIEINYLLQRMESYRGLAILATNMRSALDNAFLRRLRFIVTFPFPAIEQRREIWARAFPSGVPIGELDLDRLARLPATGAMVQNIALNASFLAAHAECDVTMTLIGEAAASEFRKLELPVPRMPWLTEASTTSLGAIA